MEDSRRMTDRHAPIRLSALTFLALLLAIPSAQAGSKCLNLKKGDFVYAVGSSTLGISLGPALKKKLTKKGIRFRKWAKASSGLARPDFHDWPAQIPDVVKEWSPHAFLVSLGTNDYQAIFTDDGWVKHSAKERWKAVYSKRIDQMLTLVAGRDKARPVIWVGPTPFNTRKARRMSVRINELLKERIAAFGGNVHYIDMVKRLMPGERPIRTFKSTSGKKLKAYGKDGVHLRGATVKQMMAAPVLAAMLCL